MAATLRLCRQYRVRGLRFDRMQAEQLTSNLARQGIRTDEFVFSASGANRLARALYGALRDRALDLPDDAETRQEFLSVRMVETGPGTVRLQNPPGTHDDIVTAVGMVVVDLVERGDPGRASITVPRGPGQTQSRSHRGHCLARHPTTASAGHRCGSAPRPTHPQWGHRRRARRLSRPAPTATLVTRVSSESQTWMPSPSTRPAPWRESRGGP